MKCDDRRDRSRSSVRRVKKNKSKAYRYLGCPLDITIWMTVHQIWCVTELTFKIQILLNIVIIYGLLSPTAGYGYIPLFCYIICLGHNKYHLKSLLASFRQTKKSNLSTYVITLFVTGTSRCNT